MRKRLSATILALLLALPAVARADEDRVPIDARLEGYSKVTTLSSAGTITTWFAVGGLAILGLGVLFKSANRSHLD